ncbi:MAG: DUF6894 family protein [Steroidobacteraceae bacterium]
MRFFFDLKSKQHIVLDYSGEDFGHHKAAIDFAKAIADDMTHRASRQWLGWSVEVVDESGRRFISVPIRIAEASGLSRIRSGF